MNTLIRIFYECVLGLTFILFLPKLLFDLIFKKKYRKSLFSRLGIGLSLDIKRGYPVIWIHAVSIGETKAIVALARGLKERYKHCLLIISSVTETGHAEAQKCLSFADYHLFLPFDFYWLANRFINLYAPNMVLLAETDFWFNFLSAAKKKGAFIGLVNGKISEKSANRFKNFSFLTTPLFRLIDLFCVQNNLYKERFLSIGIPSEKIVVTGNLKLDDEYPILSEAEIISWRHKLGIEPEQIVVTIGASHEPEEKILLELFKTLWKDFPEVKVLIVPRHPERFKAVKNLLVKEGLNFICYTDITTRSGQEQVILVDAMGLLRLCYQLSDIAICCGSYTPKVGGHNLLEPCAYGKPVLFGPYVQTQIELMEYVKAYQAGFQASPDELLILLKTLIRDKRMRTEVGDNGLKMMSTLKGATDKTLKLLPNMSQSK